MIWLFCLALLVGGECLAQGSRDWSKVESFSYQLQELDLGAASASDVDMLIIDYSADGTHENRYTPKQVEVLKREHLVLAYLSLGEAEDYRFYWPGLSAAKREGWLGRPNTAWDGHYTVRYWHPAWKAHMLRYLDAIAEAGFDGVYLDRIDAYHEIRELPPHLARAEMMNLVREVAQLSRERCGDDFGVFVQNAEELLQDPDYLDLITGIGREEVYFAHDSGRCGVPQPYTYFLEQSLDRAVRAGKLVLSVDYPATRKQTLQARERATSRGYLHFAGLRALDTLHGISEEW